MNQAVASDTTALGEDRGTWGRPAPRAATLSFRDRISRYRRRHPIGLRFLIYILLLHGFLTLLTTAAQLYLELRWDTRAIEDRVAQVAESYSSSLANALWSYDAEAIQLDLQGIGRLQDIEHLRVATPTGETFEEGTPVVQPSRRISRTYELWHQQDAAERVYLGTLEITASLEGVYARLLRRVVIILITNSTKMFPISIFIPVTFYLLVARHLDAIARYTERLDLDRLDVPLVLNRRAKGRRNDEIDQVVDAINAMRTSLSASFDERNRAERVLQESEARLRAVTDGTMAVIYVKDTAGRYVLVNNRFEELLHVRRDVARGKTDFDLFPPEVAARVQANDQRVLEGGKALDLEEVFPHPDGPHTYISLKFPILDPQGRPSAVCGISTDVTERKRAEESRIQLLAKTQEMLQLREDFLAVASHELRTPVTTIKLHAQLLERKLGKWAAGGTENSAYLSKSLKNLKGQTDHLARLVDTLADTARGASMVLRRTSFDMSRLVRDVVGAYQAQVSAAKDQVRLELQPEVMGRWDATRVEQIVLNLLTNAVKYGEGKPILFSLTSDGESATLVVQDSGIGISRDLQHRVFERFERAAPITHYGGLGLGLYITRQIVEAHGGSIRLDSEPGQGARFTVKLPLRPA